jgi:hypothetical protein
LRFFEPFRASILKLPQRKAGESPRPASSSFSTNQLA